MKWRSGADLGGEAAEAAAERHGSSVGLAEQRDASQGSGGAHVRSQFYQTNSNIAKGVRAGHTASTMVSQRLQDGRGGKLGSTSDEYFPQLGSTLLSTHERAPAK